MPEYNPIQPTSYISSSIDEFARLGNTARWRKSVSVASGSTLVCTGSFYGAAGIIAPDSATGSILLSEGGTIPFSAISGQGPVDFTIRSVTVTAGTAYVLYRDYRIE